MLSYKKLQSWVKNERERIRLIICCGLMFMVGFGSGKATHQGHTTPIVQQNYTTKQTDKLMKPANGKADTLTGQGTEAIDGKPCLIKGNISGSNKVYHVAGGAFYKKVKPEQCFASEEDARAAGFRKSSR